MAQSTAAITNLERELGGPVCAAGLRERRLAEEEREGVSADWLEGASEAFKLQSLEHLRGT
jgi:hypothetical protein